LKVHIKSLTAAPTATFTGNGTSNDVTINVGDTIVYAWSGTNGASAKATYMIDSGGACSDTTTTPAPWGYGNTLSGTYSIVAATCTGGHTYTYVYTVTGTNGTTAIATLKVHINFLSLPSPTNTAASCNSPGTYAFFSWDPVPGATAGYEVAVYVGKASCPTAQGWSTYNFSDGTHSCYVDNYNGLSCGGTVSRPWACFPTTPGVSYTAWIHGMDGNGVSPNYATLNVSCAASSASAFDPYANLASVLNAIKAILEKMKTGSL